MADLDHPVVSIALPVRDGEPWLAAALASIRAQTDGAWELLAVDDGSSDGTRRLLEAWACDDRRVRILDSRGRGIVAALNVALAAARAPLLARMDADDVCDRERLASQRAALETDPTLSAVTCQVSAFPRAQTGAGMLRYLEWQNALLDPDDLRRDRFIESPLVHPSVMMWTAAALRLGGWREVDWPEDWDLFSRAFEARMRIRRLPRVLYHWRQHDRQATRVDPRYAERRFRAARAHFLARRLRERGVGRRRALWVLGAGPVGKRLARALASEGVQATGFGDVDARKIGGRVGGLFPVVHADALREMAERPFALAAVARPGARGRIRALLASWGWREGRDFYVAA